VPLLVHAVRTLAAARTVDLVVVAAPPDDVEQVRRLLGSYDQLGAQVDVVAGGATRQESVAAALAALSPAVDVVLVHDAARPLAPAELADAVVRAVRAGAEAVVPVLPVTDTVKRVDGDGQVRETVPRADLRAVQTPQGFRREVLTAAYAAAGPTAAYADAGPTAAYADAGPAAAVTDDAGLVEHLGRPVQTVPGAEEAFKVTRPLDLLLAESLLARRRAR